MLSQPTIEHIGMTIFALSLAVRTLVTHQFVISHQVVVQSEPIIVSLVYVFCQRRGEIATILVVLALKFQT